MQKFWANFIYAAFFVAGIAGIIAGSAYIYSDVAFLRRSAKADGEIVRLEMRREGAFHHEWIYPVYRYRDKTGHSWEAMGSHHSADFTIGENIQIIYDVGDPSISDNYAPISMWIAPVSLMLWGIGMTMPIIRKRSLPILKLKMREYKNAK